MIQQPVTISDLVDRNTPPGEIYFVSLTRRDYKRV